MIDRQGFAFGHRGGRLANGISEEFVPEERIPVPNKRDRNRDIVKRVDAGNGLDRNGNGAGRRGGPEPVAQCGQNALERIVVRQLRNDDNEHNERRQRSEGPE